MAGFNTVDVGVESKAPGLIGLARKSRSSPSEQDTAWRGALAAARGCDQWPLPVYLDGRRIGWVISDPWWAPARGVWWRPEFPGERRKPTMDLAGFPTFDKIVEANTTGKKFNFGPWSKTQTTASLAGNFYDLWASGQNPGVFGGTAHTAKPIDDTTAGTIWHGGNKSTATKHLTMVWGMCSAQNPTIVLYDRVLTYEASTISNVNVVLTNTLPATRYLGTEGTATGGGMKPMCCVETNLGATGSNLTQFQYTDQSGNTLQSMPTTPTVSHITAATAATATIGARVVCPATSGATLPWGAFIPLAVGDGGVFLIDNRTWSANNTGTITWILARPLAVIPCPTAGDSTVINSVHGVTSLERIIDGAALALYAFVPTTTAFTANGGGSVAWS